MHDRFRGLKMEWYIFVLLHHPDRKSPAALIMIVHNYADTALLEPVIKYKSDQEGDDYPRLKAQRRAAMFRVFNYGPTNLYFNFGYSKNALLFIGSWPCWWCGIPEKDST